MRYSDIVRISTSMDYHGTMVQAIAQDYLSAQARRSHTEDDQVYIVLTKYMDDCMIEMRELLSTY